MLLGQHKAVVDPPTPGIIVFILYLCGEIDDVHMHSNLYSTSFYISPLISVSVKIHCVII